MKTREKILLHIKAIIIGITLMFGSIILVLIIFDLIYNGSNLFTNGFDPRLFQKKMMWGGFLVSTALSVLGVTATSICYSLASKK